jgi:5-methylcytosine-specific restriction endonuclease McrA
MKDQIIELSNAGLTQEQIALQLGCCRSTVRWHTSESYRNRQKARVRTKKYRRNPLLAKVQNFQWTGPAGKNVTFSHKDVVEKFGWETKCYLTGRGLSLREPKTYHFDHVIPRSKGGPDTLENLGITCREANQAKSDLTVDEFLGLCREVLEHHGYEVKKNEESNTSSSIDTNGDGG